MSSWHILASVLALCLTLVSTHQAKPVFIEDARQNEIGFRIVSGWPAEPGQWPWQVSLRMVNAQGGVSSCGGSIVHREWALSAAHCTALRVTLVIRAGVTSLTTPFYIFESTEWHNHPSYNDFLPSVVQPNDIAIVKLGRRLSFNELLRPIKLQSSADAFRDYNEQRMIASGFGTTWTGGGSTDYLNWVYLRGVTNSLCFTTFGSIITANTICARYWNVTSQSTCQGDSGGPLVIQENEEPVLIGVTSFVAGGTHGCHSGLPAGFIRTGPFHAWYTEITGVDFETLDFSSEEEEEIESSESSESSSVESSESEELDTTTAPPVTDKNETEEEGDTKEENGTDEEDDTEEVNETEEDGDDSSESEEKGHGHKRRCKCKVEVEVKVKMGK